MKKYFLFVLLTFSFLKFSTGQIICIKCYNQNDSISDNVNNLLLNGGFENSNCIPGWVGANVFCPNSNNYSCDITNWHCTGGASATYTSIFDSAWSQIAEGTKAAYFGNGFCHVCSLLLDDTSCISNILCTLSSLPAGYPLNDTNFGGATGVSLEQIVNGLTPGTIYVLEFWAGGESDFGTLSTNGVFGVDVGFGDTLLQDKPTPSLTGVGTTYIIEFIATSTSHTIKFTNWGHICSICTELVLDNVRLYTLAELSPSVPPCNTGIDIPDFENPEYLIYPNPARDLLVISSPLRGKEKAELIITDISGREVLKSTIDNQLPKESYGQSTINIRALKTGIYFIELIPTEGGGKRALRQKFLKFQP